MPYATDGGVTRADKSNDPAWIVINEQQYGQAVAGMQAGKLISIDGGFSVKDPPVPDQPPEPEPPTFEQLQAAKVVSINIAFAGAAAALTAGYPPAEQLTWPVQQAEAQAWAVDANAPTPYLDGLAAARGIAAEDMRALTLAQVQIFMTASQQLVGTRQRLRDLALVATTPEDLDAISWPESAPDV